VNALKKFIRQQIISILESQEKDDEVIVDSESEDDDKVKSEFSSAGGAGAIGQFGWAAPLGSKSNAKEIEKNKDKNKKK
jgi:hypothetical protein